MKVEFLNPIMRDNEYFWLLSIGDQKFGVDNSNSWYLKRKDSMPVPLSEIGNYVSLLPLLELDYSEFCEILRHSAAESLPVSDIILNFPVLPLIKDAFQKSYSDYWPKKALAWLAESPSSLPYLRLELLSYSQNTLMEQSSRQFSKRLLRAGR